MADQGPAAAAFDRAIAASAGPDGLVAAVDPGWGIGDRSNGGYLLAIAARAALDRLGQPHPLALSCHFLAPPGAGPAAVQVTRLRQGRSLSSARVALAQRGATFLEALVTAGRLDPATEPGWQAPGGPPALPPPDACVATSADAPGLPRVGLYDHLDVRLDPATAGRARGRPARALAMRGWVRFRDGRPPDPLALVQAVDALPPTTFGLGLDGWAPTVALTVLVRALPAPGWLACVAAGRLWQQGFVDEDVEVWDARGRLVAQARQLAGARPRR